MKGEIHMVKGLVVRFVSGLVVMAALALPMAAQAGSKVVSSGSFVGASNHVTRGGVSVIKTDNGIQIVLEGDFFLDGAPDPKLGFGKSGKYDAKTTFAVLSKLKGRQVYQLPASVDPERYNEFYVWCEKFAVPLGVAKLK